MGENERTHYSSAEQAELEAIARFLEAHRAEHGDDAVKQLFFAALEDGSQISLPQELYDILVQAVNAFNQGKAVTVSLNSVMISKQEAAELLGVTRDDVITLIEGGELDATTVGENRRLKLDEVIAYRKVLRGE